MAQIGEIRKGKDIGYPRSHATYIWLGCEQCGVQRWVKIIRKEQPESRICLRCARARDRNGRWKGGRRIDKDGYVRLHLAPSDFFYTMACKDSYVCEHRLVMAKYLGRCLHSWEVVHHKDGDKLNNRIENLELCTKQGHISSHNKGYRDGYSKGLGDGRLQQIQELKTQNEELLKQIKIVQLQNRHLIELLKYAPRSISGD